MTAKLQDTPTETSLMSTDVKTERKPKLLYFITLYLHCTDENCVILHPSTAQWKGAAKLKCG